MTPTIGLPSSTVRRATARSVPSGLASNTWMILTTGPNASLARPVPKNTFPRRLPINTWMSGTIGPLAFHATCPTKYLSEKAANKHMDAQDHWAPRFPCETCSKKFLSRETAIKHMNLAEHWAPRETCSKKFLSRENVIKHMNLASHWGPRFPCETCHKKFRYEDNLHAHMEDEGHYSNYCKPCARAFMNQNNLRIHLNSKVHRGANIVCPFCKAGYTTASGLTHHLENGSCPRASGLNRETIHRMVRQRDTQGLITQKRIEGPKVENARYTATNRAFNGYYWECYICHREFNTAECLNRHLNSPVHKQKVYHCPNSKKCGKEFVSLAGLFNHLESETCDFMRFEKVQRHIGDVLQGRKAISFG